MRRSRGTRFGVGWVLVIAGFCSDHALTAATQTPASPLRDDDVVERLPTRLLDGAERARRRNEQQVLLRRSHDPSSAAIGARSAIDRYRRLGDPRDLGAAQAWLQPWWNDSKITPTLRLLKAVVLQSRHEFDAAIRELDTLLETAAPTVDRQVLQQALLTRAGVLQVVGRWQDARIDCARLAAAPWSLPHGHACLAELDGLTGRETDAQRQFDALERSASTLPPGWLALLRAELADRRGDENAGALYVRALQLADDIYSRNALVDWLLARNRSDDAAQLVRDFQRDADSNLESLPDSLLLRLAIATRNGRDPEAGSIATALQKRLDDALLRGDVSHGRERARYALDVRGDARAALALATDNWRQQKEPADALLLVRAAKAARRLDAIEPIKRFARERNYRDVRLELP